MAKEIDSCLDCKDCEKTTTRNGDTILSCARHSQVIGMFANGSKLIYSLPIPVFCCPPTSAHQEYNKKAFLLPTSINSLACYHAKIDKEGIYKFSLHDCNGGIRLRGDLNKHVDLVEAIDKFKALEDALREFRLHLELKYDTTDYTLIR